MKKNNLKRVAAYIVVVAMVFSSLVFYQKEKVQAATRSQADAVAWAKAQEGKYLDMDGYYGAQCVDLILAYYDYLGVPRSFGNAYEFAYNTLPDGWKRIKNTPDFVPEPGDIMVWTNQGWENGHVAIVLSADAHNFTSVDQNWPKGTQCKEVYHNYNYVWGVIRPQFEASTHDPRGCVDIIEGGINTVKVSGWAFDEDDVNAALDIRVYVGDSEAHPVKANTSRPDVNQIYGTGSYHGFEATIRTGRTGDQVISVFAMDVGGGHTALLRRDTVHISEPPVVSEYYGDVNCDKQITVQDISVMNQMVRSTAGYSQDQIRRADLNGDGNITSADLELLQNYYFGTISSFPVESMLGSISIQSKPTKLIYKVGESLNLSGLRVAATYNNGNTRTVTGYRVSGSVASAGNQKITISYTESGVTKTAEFYVTVNEIQKKQLTYNANGGNNAPSSVTAEVNTVVRLSSQKPQKTIRMTYNANGGRVSASYLNMTVAFSYWNTKADGSGTSYGSGSSYKLTENTTLYAIYSYAALPSLATPTRTGYTFDGWYVNGSRVSAGTRVKSDVTLVAKWTRQAAPTPTPTKVTPTPAPTPTPARFTPSAQPTPSPTVPSYSPSAEPTDSDDTDDEDPDDYDDLESEESSVEWNVSSALMQVGTSTTAVETYVTGEDEVVDYRFSNNQVAAIDSEGKITALRTGQTTITAITQKGKQAQVAITVQSGTVTTRRLTVNQKRVTLSKGGIFHIETEVTPITSIQKVTYKSKNSKIAAVTSSGKIIGKRTGNATILVKSGNKTVKVKVTVK